MSKEDLKMAIVVTVIISMLIGFILGKYILK